MSGNQNQPKDFDAVLGGESPPPASGVVLGGIDGIKNRLNSSNFQVCVAALEDAMSYGDVGLDLLIETLSNCPQQVQRFVVKLLKQRGGEKGKQALLDFDPWLFFTKLENWTREDFNPKVGITNPEGKAYVVNLEYLKLLLQDSQANKVEALICHLFDGCDYEISREFYSYVEALFDKRHLLTNIKALFLGDSQDGQFKKSYIGLGDISLILEAFPNLEVLQIRGCCKELECEKQQHSNLKTLIIESLDNSDAAIYQFCSLDLPSLEYFELWIGRDREHSWDETIDSLKPILFSESFPNLKYLGLRSSDYADMIAEAINQSSFSAEFPIIDNLEVLDLSMGSLTDEGLASLIDCEAINNLHTLDISNNCVSQEFIEEIKQSSLLDCILIAHSQTEMSHRNCSASRYWVLHE